MLRLFIFIFALNAFAPPATAAIACEMMDSTSMVAMEKMVEMTDTETNCGMHEDVSCNSTQCVTNCATYASPIVFDSVQNFNLDWLDSHPQFLNSRLYRIFLPINTPPPLV